MTFWFEKLDECYVGNLKRNLKKEKNYFPQLIKTFESWLIKYSDYDLEKKEAKNLNNKIVYSIKNQEEYKIMVNIQEKVWNKFTNLLYDNRYFFGKKSSNSDRNRG